MRAGHAVRLAGGGPADRRERAVRGDLAELQAPAGVRRPGAGLPRRPPLSRPRTRWSGPGCTRPSARPPSGCRFSPTRARCSPPPSTPTKPCASSPTSRSHASPTGAASSSSARAGSCATSRSPTSIRTGSSSPSEFQTALPDRSRLPTTGVPNVIRTGRAELSRRSRDEMLVEAAVDSEHLGMIRELGLVSVMIVPLQARGRRDRRPSHSWPRSRAGKFDERDLELAEDLARRAALAIDNSMLFKREHEAAVILQRSLLPQSLPELDGIELAVRYCAGGARARGRRRLVRGRGAEDNRVVALDDRYVAGRGVRAASIMGRVRPALTGRCGLEGAIPPDESIRRLDALIKESEQPEMATSSTSVRPWRPGIGRTSRRADPPALLRRPAGEVVDLDGPAPPRSGSSTKVEFRQHEVKIPAGDLDPAVHRRPDRAPRRRPRPRPGAPAASSPRPGIGRGPPGRDTQAPRTTRSMSRTTWRCSRDC